MQRIRNGRTKRGIPEIVVRNGKPSAVILDIDDYQELLEELEDLEDIRTLEKIRRKTLKFRPFSEFLKEHNQGV
ncbi:MAG: hypothetical protein A2W23_06785 [Planctomycetes bacterium RBG_16_43_13]|nr:MAG: hypothetical protein A2W23_06785 [Planctomycetes bacterium RBG_16_43_13]